MMNVENVDRELMTIKQVCEYLHISRRTVNNWMSKGKIQFIYTAGGSRRIYKDTLLKKTKTKLDFSNPPNNHPFLG
jgi:excisionase family DNA binding protein